MRINGEETDILRSYRSNDAEGRLAIMLNNYAVFPKIIRKAEKKIQYKIKSEKEYLRSHARCELGVRVQTSGTSDPTFNEACLTVFADCFGYICILPFAVYPAAGYRKVIICFSQGMI